MRVCVSTVRVCVSTVSVCVRVCLYRKSRRMRSSVIKEKDGIEWVGKVRYVKVCGQTKGTEFKL